MGSTAPQGTPEHLVVGHVTKAHGTRGEVFVWLLTDRPKSVFAEGNDLLIGDRDGRLGDDPEVVTVEKTRPFKKGLLVKFEDLERREDVDDMAGRYLLMPSEHLEPLDEGEHFYHQLLGLEVVTADGVELGRVREVFETDPVHLLEVRGASGKVHLVPFSEQIVRQVDAATQKLVIDPPPGLLEL